MSVKKGKFGVISNTKVDFEDLSTANVWAQDIAFGQCNMPRYAGATLAPMSVATHSLILAYVFSSFMLPKSPITSRTIMYALCHDWAEIFVGDMPAPAKNMVPEFSKFENQVFESLFAGKLGWGEVGPHDLEKHKIMQNAVHFADKNCWNLEEPIFQEAAFVGARSSKHTFIEKVCHDHYADPIESRLELLAARDESLFFIAKWVIDLYDNLRQFPTFKDWMAVIPTRTLENLAVKMANNIRTLIIHQVRYKDYLIFTDRVISMSIEIYKNAAYTFEDNRRAIAFNEVFDRDFSNMMNSINGELTTTYNKEGLR